MSDAVDAASIPPPTAAARRIHFRSGVVRDFSRAADTKAPMQLALREEPSELDVRFGGTEVRLVMSISEECEVGWILVMQLSSGRLRIRLGHATTSRDMRKGL